MVAPGMTASVATNSWRQAEMVFGFEIRGEVECDKYEVVVKFESVNRLFASIARPQNPGSGCGASVG